MTITDIDLQNKTLQIKKGKGGHDRVVPLGEKTVIHIQEFLLHIRPKLLKDQSVKSLFISYRKQKLTASGLSKRFMKIQQMMESEFRTNAHAFRHACATDLLRNGAALQDIAEILGHARMQTTQRYPHLVKEDLKRSHKKFHPRG